MVFFRLQINSKASGGVCASTKNRILVALALVFVLFLMAVSLHAQTASTSIVTGTVLDKSGASVPNATVELEDIDTKAKTSVISGADGEYSFHSVRPGITALR